MRDMDAPTSFFFNLERKAAQDKQNDSLNDSAGRITSDPVEMRRLAVDFYSTLFAAENSDGHARKELLQDLPVLTSEQKEFVEKRLTFDEVTASVMELSLGRTPGIDGLPTEFYRSLWTVIGNDFFKVLQESTIEGSLPKSCQRAVLTLLPKKGDLTLLKKEAGGTSMFRV